MFPRQVYYFLSKRVKHQSIELRKFTSTTGNGKIIYTKYKDLNLPRITLHEHLWKNLDTYANKTATICLETRKSYTYNDVYKKSLAVAGFLKNSLKLNENEAVAMVLPNIPEYPIILLGAVQAGLKVTTCNPTYTSDEIKRQILNSETKAVFTSKQLLPLVKAAVNNINTKIPIIEVVDQANNGLSENVISFDEISSGTPMSRAVDTNIHETILLPYSSGTTGVPKGVQLSHFNVVANLCQTATPDFNLMNPDGQDVLTGFLPFFHIYGLTMIMLHGLAMGAKIVTMPKFSSDTFIKVLKEHKPTVIHAVPLVVHMIINNPNITAEDLKNTRYLNSGAAPLGAADVERFKTKTKDTVTLVQAYGMTEAAPLVSQQNNKLENGIKIGGCGVLVPNTVGKIVSTDDIARTECLDPCQPGELLIKGPQIMSGYFKNENATKESFVDGWYKTGDIGYYDEDGHLFITDRLKELIKVKGFQVAPAELEEILRDHPKVEEAAVIGVPHPENGEAPKAFIVPKVGEKLKSSDLEEFVASKVSKHKHLLGGVTFVDQIPKNPSGKILRRELKKM